MAYPERRLLEALRVIREDNDRLHTLEADKLARTQYRDGFHLRKATSNLQPIHTWRQDDSSDDEYDPSRKKKKLKKLRDDEYNDDSGKRNGLKPKSKRRLVKTGIETDHDDYINHPAKRPRLENSNQPLTSSSVFTTIAFKSERAQLFLLQKLRRYQETHINIYHLKEKDRGADLNPWRLSSGSLHCCDRSGTQNVQDFEVAQALQEPLEQLVLSKPRTLRSGKILVELVPKKRPINEIEDDDEENDNNEVTDQSLDLPTSLDSHLNSSVPEPKRHKMNNDDVDTLQYEESRGPTTPIRKIIPERNFNIHSGACEDDAISISSSSPRSRSITPDISPLTSINPPSSATTAPSPTSYVAPIPHQDPHPNSSISTMTTSFSHPINFRSTHFTSCNFHNDYRHPILGHGPTTTTYTHSATHPSQLTATNHRHNPLPPDTMCVPCALSYLQIIRCKIHTPTRLFAIPRSPTAHQKANKAYMDDLFTRFKRGDPRRNKVALTQTCALCPAPATYRCCTPQSHDKCLRPCRFPHESFEAARSRVQGDLGRCGRQEQGQMQIQNPILGCGLLMCSTCKMLVGDRCQGNMQENRAMVLRALRSVGMGARADVEFLFEEGLVWLAYNVDGRV